MALVKLAFQPGFNRDWTNYANTGGWWDGDLVRFRNGLPETMGGWTLITSAVLSGVCRSIWSWTAIDGTEWTGLGTHLKFYVEKGGVLTDVTPIRVAATAMATDPLTATSGSTTVTVTHAGHGAGVGDYMTIAGAVTINLTASEINKEHQITNVVDSDTLEIEVTTAATGSGADGGASMTVEFQISVGAQNFVGGTGWGAGPFGGAASARLNATLGLNPLDTINTSKTITVNHTSHGATTGDWIIMSGATATNGVPVSELNRAHEVTVTGANAYTITVLDTAATSTGSSGGSSVMIAYYQESDTGWGDGAASGTALTPRIWSQDNYGEDLILCPRDKPLYYWDKTGFTNAVAFTNISGMDADVPIIAKEIAVSSARHVIAFACNPLGESDQDPLLIRWANTEDFKTWFPTSENAAGRLRIEHGSFFVTHLETRQEIVVWTDTAILSMQFLGPPFTYGIVPIATNTTIFGPNAKATAQDITYWMGTDNFYMYDGRVRPIPCTVWDYVFGDINYSGSFQVMCGTNRAFNEIIWFYPSAGSFENDRYVIYNYADNLWYFGSGLFRTAWLDRGFDEKPRGVSEDGSIFYHESGFDDGSTTPSAALAPFIEGSPMEIGDGESFMFMWRLLPDVTFRASSADNPTATVSVTPRQNPGSARGTPVTSDTDRTSASSATVEEFTDALYMRVRGRSLIYKISSNERGVGWRQGVPRIDVRTDGRR